MELSVLNLLTVLFVAWLAGQLAERVGYPAVLGELIAGILLGPPVLGLLYDTEALTVLAELGIIVMMLYIGMEIDPAELGKASLGGLLAAVGGFIAPFVLCYLAVVWAGYSQMAAIFVGVAAGVTSLATKSRILVDLQLLDTRVAHVLMAGALVADTLSLVIFAAVIGVAEAGIVDLQAIVVTFLQAVAFFAVAWVAGTRLLPPIARHLKKLGTTATFMAILVIGLLFAEGAELAGMHGVLGAFLGGLFLREQVFGRTLSERLMDLVEHVSIGFLAPIFFVTAGFAVSLDVLATDTLLVVLVVVLATIGKIMGTGLFYLPTGFGWREGIVIGAGMNGRGAVEIIMAQIAMSLGMISQDIFSILVFMAIITTATVPLLLKWGVAWLRSRDQLVRAATEREGTIIVGAGPTARALGRVLRESQPVRVIDRNTDLCELARREGLEAIQGDALDERILAQADASHTSSLVAMTTNPEVNALSAKLAREVFHIPEVHLLKSGSEEEREALGAHLGATALFAEPISLEDWNYHIEHARTKTVDLSVDEELNPAQLVRRVQEPTPAIPLAIHRDEQYLPFHSGSELEKGDRIILLEMKEVPALPTDRLDQLIRDAIILDIEREIEAPEFFEEAGRALSSRVDVEADTLASSFALREDMSSTVIMPGVAIPHATIDGKDQLALLVARSRKGITFPEHEESIHTVFVLVNTPDERNFYLRTLAAIANIVQQPEFKQQWTEVETAEDLRKLMLQSPAKLLSGINV